MANKKLLRLRRAAGVAVVESANLRQGYDIAELGWLDSAWRGRVLLESEMRARAVVVAEVAAKTTAEVSLVQDDHVVEEFAPDRADHTLGEGVLPRRSRSSENLINAHDSHPLLKLGAVDAVAIAQEVVWR